MRMKRTVAFSMAVHVCEPSALDAEQLDEAGLAALAALSMPKRKRAYIPDACGMYTSEINSTRAEVHHLDALIVGVHIVPVPQATCGIIRGMQKACRLQGLWRQSKRPYAYCKVPETKRRQCRGDLYGGRRRGPVAPVRSCGSGFNLGASSKRTMQKRGQLFCVLKKSSIIGLCGTERTRHKKFKLPDTSNGGSTPRIRLEPEARRTRPRQPVIAANSAANMTQCEVVSKECISREAHHLSSSQNELANCYVLHVPRTGVNRHQAKKGYPWKSPLPSHWEYWSSPPTVGVCSSHGASLVRLRDAGDHCNA